MADTTYKKTNKQSNMNKIYGKSSNVIDLGCKSKARMQLPINLLVMMVTLYVSPTVFEILTHFARK